MRWERNELGRWTSDDGQWAVLPVGQCWQVMRKTGPGSYDWDRLDVLASVDAARALVRSYSDTRGT